MPSEDTRRPSRLFPVPTIRGRSRPHSGIPAQPRPRPSEGRAVDGSRAGAEADEIRVGSLPELADIARRAGGRANLLLGNGHSIAWDGRFAYGSIFDNISAYIGNIEAAAAQLPIPDELAEELHPRHDIDPNRLGLHGYLRGLEDPDLEQVLGELESVKAFLTRIGYSSGTLIDWLDQSIRWLRQLFVEIISDALRDPLHGLKQVTIHKRSRAAGAAQATAFDYVYTTNYDPLLYLGLGEHNEWADTADGFLRREEDLVYRGYFPEGRVPVMYLHGALHFVRDPEGGPPRKITGGSSRFLDALAVRIEAGTYPLVVFEGSHAKKRQAIASDPYLRQTHAAFGRLKGSLVVAGLLNSMHERIKGWPESKSLRLMMVFEEAHRVLKEKKLQPILELFARTARAKGVGLLVVSQVAVDLPPAVRNNCATKIQMQTNYAQDLTRAAQVYGSSYKEIIPRLKQGQGALHYPEYGSCLAAFRPRLSSPSPLSEEAARFFTLEREVEEAAALLNATGVATRHATPDQHEKAPEDADDGAIQAHFPTKPASWRDVATECVRNGAKPSARQVMEAIKAKGLDPPSLRTIQRFLAHLS